MGRHRSAGLHTERLNANLGLVLAAGSRWVAVTIGRPYAQRRARRAVRALFRRRRIVRRVSIVLVRRLRATTETLLAGVRSIQKTMRLVNRRPDRRTRRRRFNIQLTAGMAHRIRSRSLSRPPRPFDVRPLGTIRLTGTDKTRMAVHIVRLVGVTGRIGGRGLSIRT